MATTRDRLEIAIMKVEEFVRKENVDSLKWQAYVRIDFTRAQMIASTTFENLTEAGQILAKERGCKEGENVSLLLQVKQDSPAAVSILSKDKGITLDWLQPEKQPTEAAVEGKSKCFIATAAFGSPLAFEIKLLQDYRDRYLRRNAAGRMLIAAYETIGPLGATILRRFTFLKPSVRFLIVHICRMIQQRRNHE